MKKIQYLLPPAILLITFIIWTILVKTVDVQFINPIGFLGFYTFNTSINEFVQAQNTHLFSVITDVMLYISFATIVPFAVMGLIQLIKRKSFAKVDPVLYIMAGAYAVAAITYVIFEIVKINYSPLSTPEKIKPSYPSSHLLLFAIFMCVNLYGLFHYVKLPKWGKIGGLCCVIALIIGMFVLRLFSGNHYFTDLIGGILLSLSIVATFNVVTRKILSEPKAE